MSHLVGDPSEIKKIGEICDLINGRGFKPFEWAPDGLPIIRIQNLNGSDNFNYFSGSYNPKIQIESGDLLFAWSGSRGTSFGPHIWRGPTAVLNYHTWKVRPHGSVNQTYLYHALKGLTKKIEDDAHGASALVHTQKREMVHYEVWIPDADQQAAVAQALSDVDDLIASLDALIAKKRDIKQGAMQQLLSGRRRLPGFSIEWDTQTLGTLGEITGSGVDKKTIEGQRSVRLLNYVDVYKHNYIDAGTPKQTVTASDQQIRRCCIQKGDVFFTYSSETPQDAAHAAVALQSFNDAVYSYHLVRWRPNRPFDPDYLAFAFQTDLFRQQSLIACEGSGTRYVITLPRFRALTLSYPPIEEQAAIGKTLRDLANEIACLALQKAKYEELRQGMIQQLLTGKIRLV